MSIVYPIKHCKLVLTAKNSYPFISPTLQCLWRQEACDSPEAGITGWEQNWQNSGPLQKQCVLLTAEPSKYIFLLKPRVALFGISRFVLASF